MIKNMLENLIVILSNLINYLFILKLGCKVIVLTFVIYILLLIIYAPLWNVVGSSSFNIPFEKGTLVWID